MFSSMISLVSSDADTSFTDDTSFGLRKNDWPVDTWTGWFDAIFTSLAVWFPCFIRRRIFRPIRGEISCGRPVRFFMSYFVGFGRKLCTNLFKDWYVLLFIYLSCSPDREPCVRLVLILWTAGRVPWFIMFFVNLKSTGMWPGPSLVLKLILFWYALQVYRHRCREILSSLKLLFLKGSIFDIMCQINHFMVFRRRWCDWFMNFERENLYFC